MYNVSQKLKKVKLDLKTWSKRTFGNFRSKLERKGEKLLHVEQKLTLQPHSARLNNWHYRLLKQREKMHLFNQKYWGTLARKDWLVNGDRHSRYFHQSMKAQKMRGKIFKIQDASGIWIDEPTSLKQLFVHDFSSRFSSARAHTASPHIALSTRVSKADNALLLRPIQDCEVKEALFQMDKYKTPGPDGFGDAFFQDFWHMIAPDVCHAIKSFFHDGKMLETDQSYAHSINSQNSLSNLDNTCPAH